MLNFLYFMFIICTECYIAYCSVEIKKKNYLQFFVWGHTQEIFPGIEQNLKRVHHIVCAKNVNRYDGTRKS